jgi:hypothetical protein
VAPAVSVVELRSVDEIPAASEQSLLALSWLNFFLSGLQAAFGPIAAAYLAARGGLPRTSGLSSPSAAALVDCNV